MRILITGASGFVGSHLGKHLSMDHDVLGVVFRSLSRPLFRCESVDLTAHKAVATLLQSFRPQVIVHAAAMSRVVQCEDSPDEAETVNVAATENLIQWAERLHSKFVFLSSDQVFSGNRGGYRESHDPDPVSVYGRTKLEAERVVLASTVPCLILRSNSVVGPSVGWGGSFSDMVREKLRAGQKLSLFDDQFRSPIHIRSMVQVLAAACLAEFSGLLHIGGLHRLSRLNTGYAVARAYGLSPDLIESVSYKSHPRAQILTADNSYDISRFKQLMPLIKLRPLDEDFEEDAKHGGI